MTKQWAFIPAIQLSPTSATTLLGGSLAFAEANTVLRMLGGYLITPDGATVAGDAAQLTVGIGVISTDAFAAGAGSVPDPNGEPEYPWLYWRDHQLRYPSATTVLKGEGDQTGAGTERVHFDIKSMRKLKPRESLVFIVSYTDVTGTPPLKLDVGRTRVLIGLT